MRGREEAVVRRPCDQHRLVEGGQLRGGVEGVPRVEAGEQLAQVAADAAAGQHRQDVGVLGLAAPAARSRASRRRSAAAAACAPAGRRRPPGSRRGCGPARAPSGRAAAGSCRTRRRRLGRRCRCARACAWRGSESGRRRCRCRRSSRPRARAPRARPAIRSASAGGVRSASARHRLDVRAERQVERHARAPVEQRHHLAPQVGVHERAVDEHDRRALAGHVRADPPARAEVERRAGPERDLQAPASRLMAAARSCRACRRRRSGRRPARPPRAGRWRRPAPSARRARSAAAARARRGGRDRLLLERAGAQRRAVDARVLLHQREQVHLRDGPAAAHADHRDAPAPRQRGEVLLEVAARRPARG